MICACVLLAVPRLFRKTQMQTLLQVGVSLILLLYSVGSGFQCLRSFFSFFFFIPIELRGNDMQYVLCTFECWRMMKLVLRLSADADANTAVTGYTILSTLMNVKEVKTA